MYFEASFVRTYHNSGKSFSSAYVFIFFVAKQIPGTSISFWDKSTCCCQQRRNTRRIRGSAFFFYRQKRRDDIRVVLATVTQILGLETAVNKKNPTYVVEKIRGAHDIYALSSSFMCTYEDKKRKTFFYNGVRGSYSQSRNIID